MSNHLSGEELIRDLLANPAKFNEDGRAYDLLQQYFRGFPVSTLRPLLADADEQVRRAAVWVTAELGREGCSLLHDVVRLLANGSRHVRYYALEVVMVCSVGENSVEFGNVVRSLESEDEVIRLLAMRLVSNADAGQLEVANTLFESLGSTGKVHARGLCALLKGSGLAREEVLAMLDDSDPVVRKYGAIAAKRLLRELPELLLAAKSSEDLEVREFAEEVA